MKVISVLVGGWEFTKEDGIDEEIARMALGKILLIPDASRFPEKQIERANVKYKNYNTEVVLLKESDESIPKGIEVVYLGGGQPELMMEYFYKRKKLLKDLFEKWKNKEIVLCGSSTGAMVQFKEMLAEDSRGKGNTNLVPGLGFIKNSAVVIPHWDEKSGIEGREWRKRFLDVHRDKLIIGVNEYTGLFWGEKEARVVGLGKVNILQKGKLKTYKNGDIISDLELKNES